MKTQRNSALSSFFSIFKGTPDTLQKDKSPVKEDMQKVKVVASKKDHSDGKTDPKPSAESANERPKDVGIWEYPPLTLLADSQSEIRNVTEGEVKKMAGIIEQTAHVFGLLARVIEVNFLPFCDQFLIEYEQGTEISKFFDLVDEFAFALDISHDKVQFHKYTSENKNLISLEISSNLPSKLSLKSMLFTDTMRSNRSKLAVALGLDTSTKPVIADIGEMPHLLITGSTSLGISNLLNVFILSILFRTTPSEVKLILIDPKRVEMVGYNGISHLLTPVIVDVQKILSALRWVVSEVDRRYKVFSDAGVRSIDSYNELSGFQALPYIVIIIDELASLETYALVETEDAITRLVHMGNTAGIHLILATSQGSNNVVKKLLKTTIPCKIIIDSPPKISDRATDTRSSEEALKKFNLLFFSPDQAKPMRIQEPYVTEDEISKLVKFLKDKGIPIEYTEEVEVKTQTLKFKKPIEQDDLFEEAVRIVCQFDRASASLLQRKLSVGYARAARILDQLEEVGIVGPGEGAVPRDVLVRNAEEFFRKQE